MKGSLEPVSNLKLVFFSRVFALVIVAIGAIPMIVRTWPTSWQMIFLGCSLGIVVLYWIIFRPSFFSLEFAQGSLYMSTDREGVDEFYYCMPVTEFVDYRIDTRYFGLRRTLFLFRKGQQGLMKSPPTNISMATKGTIITLKETLDSLVKHGHRYDLTSL